MKFLPALFFKKIHLHGKISETMLILKYLSFSISIAFISWIVGMIINGLLRKSAIYRNAVSDLNFIKSENTNRNIGIGTTKWIIKNSFLKYFNQKLKLKAKTDKTSLIHLRNEMNIAETDHLIGFIFVAIFALIKLANAEYLFAIIIMILNVLMNLYPSLLQQENKRRIDRAIKNLG